MEAWEFENLESAYPGSAVVDVGERCGRASARLYSLFWPDFSNFGDYIV